MRNDPIAYLWNEMPEPKRAAFAERWFTDAELYERLRMAEAELLDHYVRGESRAGSAARSNDSCWDPTSNGAN